jgi:hypothetical protein
MKQIQPLIIPVPASSSPLSVKALKRTPYPLACRYLAMRGVHKVIYRQVIRLPYSGCRPRRDVAKLPVDVDRLCHQQYFAEMERNSPATTVHYREQGRIGQRRLADMAPMPGAGAPWRTSDCSTKI